LERCCQAKEYHQTPDKVAGPPQSVAEVPSYLFLAGANADFRKRFAQSTALLRELLKVNDKFQWTS